MRKYLLFIIVLLSAWIAYGGGPLYTHEDRLTNLEFQNVYQDLKRDVASDRVVGVSSNTTGASGYIGEYTSSAVVAFINIGTSNQYSDLASVSLTPGDWDITGQVWFSSSNAVGTSDFSLAISSSAGNSSTGLELGINRIGTAAPTTGTSPSGTIVYRALIPTTATYYLKTNGTYSSGNPKACGIIRARRVR